MTSPRLSPGTQVVLRVPLPGADGSAVQKGSTGRVVGDAGSGYLVRLHDGRDVEAARGQLTLRRAYQQAVGIGEPDPRSGHELVRGHTIYAAVVGSRAFGLNTEGSDTDVRGVYVAPTQSFWGLVKPPVHVDGPEPEWFSWEVERFCALALKSNPNLLEMMSSPLPVVSSALGDELLELRPAFVSQLAYQTYNGYAISQFAKLEADLRRDGVPRWKHVMHLLRLLLAAESLLRTGELSSMWAQIGNGCSPFVPVSSVGRPPRRGGTACTGGSTRPWRSPYCRPARVWGGGSAGGSTCADGGSSSLQPASRLP